MEYIFDPSGHGTPVEVGTESQQKHQHSASEQENRQPGQAEAQHGMHHLYLLPFIPDAQ